MTAGPVTSPHLCWPPDRFFWCLIDAPAWTGPVPAGLWPSLEEQVPVPMSHLHAVCTPAPGGALLVCAARRDDLSALDPATLSLAPSHMPPFLDAPTLTLNLLVGEFEPRAIRSARRRTRVLAAAALLACSALVTVGLYRRTLQWRVEANAAASAAGSLAMAAVPGGDPASIHLELARLRSAAASPLPPGQDAAPILAALLAGWPRAVACRTQSISVSSTGASIAAAIEGDPGTFLNALRPPPGWTMEEPRLNTVDRTSRLAIHFRPAPRPAP